MVSPYKSYSSDDKRRSKRYPANIDAFLIFERTRYDITIRDVSDLGCCFAGEVVVQKGDEIVFQFGPLSVVATIAWSAPPLNGANFHREIDPLRVMRISGDRPAFLNRRRADSMIPPGKG